MNARHTRSPSPTSSPAIGAMSFNTGALSPVRAASSISRVAATSSRPSAGTRLPASKSTMSPGTSSAASISTATPSRRTRAMSFSIFCRAARLASAFASWRSPSTALKIVRPTRTTVVPTSPVTIWFTIAAPTRMICIRSWYWRRKACRPDSVFLASSTLDPCSCRRRSTSDCDSPWAGSTSRRVATSSGDNWYQRGDRSPGMDSGITLALTTTPALVQGSRHGPHGRSGCWIVERIRLP